MNYSNKKHFLLFFIIALVQYYDYHIIGFYAPIIGEKYFSDSSKSLQLTNVYMMMFIAALAKPMFSIILGRIGDIYGRSKSINIGVFCTTYATLIIAILPVVGFYSKITPIMFTICRMIVSAFNSIGNDGVRIYIYEMIGRNKRAFGESILVALALVGSFLSAFVANFFSQNIYSEYSWRYPFFIGATIGFLLIFSKNIFKIQDDNYVIEHKNYNKYKNITLFILIKNNFSLFICCSLIFGSLGATFQFMAFFLPTYNYHIINIVSEPTMKEYCMYFITLYGIFSIISGIMLDILNKVKLLTVGGAIILILSLLMVYDISIGKFRQSIYLFIAILSPFIVIPALIIIKDSIQLSIRYRLLSFSHMCGSIIISASSSYIAITIYNFTKITYLPILYYVLSILIIIFVSNYLSKKNYLYF